MIEVIVAVIGALALAMGAFLTYLAAKRSGDMARLAALEERLDAAEKTSRKIGLANQRLWRHNRELTDHIYRELGPPPPPFPEGLFDDDN